MVNSNFVSKTDCQPPIQQSVCSIFGLRCQRLISVHRLLTFSAFIHTVHGFCMSVQFRIGFSMFYFTPHLEHENIISLPWVYVCVCAPKIVFVGISNAQTVWRFNQKQQNGHGRS